MPTYDYQCDACGHSWELFQKITDDPIKKCPACGKRKAVRQFGTGAAVMFKGSGFYETDYRSESYKKAAKAESKSGSESTTSTDGKSSEAKSSDTKSVDSAGNSASKPQPNVAKTNNQDKPTSRSTKSKKHP